MIIPYFPWIRIHDTQPDFDTIAPGANAQNGLICVDIMRDLGSDESWIGVLAQEIYEFYYKWTHGLVVVAMFPPLGRELELRGQATEIAAYKYFSRPDDVELNRYVEEQARSIPMYSQFSGWTPEKAKEELLKRVDSQLEWVKKNESFLLRQVAKR